MYLTGKVECRLIDDGCVEYAYLLDVGEAKVDDMLECQNCTLCIDIMPQCSNDSKFF